MNKQTIKTYIGIVIGLILSFNVGLYAWSGLQAETGDKLSLTKWNELASNVWGKNGLASYYTAGNVGIGTSAPSYSLDVKNTIGIFSEGKDSVFWNKTVSDSNLYTSHFIGTRSRGTFSVPTYPKNGDWLATFQGRDGVDMLSWPSMSFVATEDFTSTKKGTSIYFATVPNGQTGSMEAMRINHNGNVGIGNNNPQAKLDIISNGMGLSLSRSGYDTYGFEQSVGLGMGIKNITDNRTELYFNGAGSIGIGTTSSNNNKLHVVGGSLSVNPTGITEMHQIGGVSIQHGGPYWPERAIQIAPATQNQNSVILQAAKDASSTHWWTYGVETNNSFHISRGAGTLGGDFVINSAGNILIGGTLTQSSDQRYKKDITNISNSLQKLQNINGVYYKRKDETKSKDTQIGFIAQNLEKEFPELVSTDTNGYKSVNYSNMTAVLVESIKELNKKINEKDNQINDLSERLKNLEKSK